MIKWEIVRNQERFDQIVSQWKGPFALDTETFGKAHDPAVRHLLGYSLSPAKSTIPTVGIYVPVTIYEGGSFYKQPQIGLEWLTKQKYVGHNFTYDWRWLKTVAGVETSWIADTRIMWHLASAPAGPRPYSLKDAQTEVLGWPERNDKELALNVEAKGGKLSNGDHYLADLTILAKYACLDTYATIELYKKLCPFFDDNDYWPFLSDIMAYNQLLEANTYLGIAVNEEGLLQAHNRILRGKELALKRFHKQVKLVVGELEADWRDRRIAKYKREYNKTQYLQNPDKWEKFNLNSDAHKRELFYGKLNFPVVETTESGKPSTSADAIKGAGHPAIEDYLKYEKYNTLSSNFTKPYLESLGSDKRLRPGFNICGTVSYRLSGFKPYLLNAPFDEKLIMKNLVLDEGMIGVHADLAAIEPTITAHYSEDPALLKVFRDGLGDIYLDLALELFKNDKELQEGYNPNAPITKEIKERFSKQRKVAKIIQLAVQYTGTGNTVSRNLTKEGMPTDVPTATEYVRAYWRKFRAVEKFNYQLRELNRKEGHLRNVIGRIIRVPDPDYKDLPNRFVQSSAHDVLIAWVLTVYSKCEEYGIPIQPVLLDCHDSTSNATDEINGDTLKNIYLEALQEVNKRLGLCVEIKCEIKTFRTLAGLKGDEK